MTLSSDDLPVPLRPMSPMRSPSTTVSARAIEQRMEAEREFGGKERQQGHGSGGGAGGAGGSPAAGREGMGALRAPKRVLSQAGARAG